MSRFQTFCFDNYSFNEQQKTVKLTYSYDNSLSFTETYRFDFDFVEYDPEILNTAIQGLFLMAGISYYKAYLAPNISISTGELPHVLAQFYSQTYQQGLGEFFYVNNLDPTAKIIFPSNEVIPTSAPEHSGKGKLIGIGGGKDSLVSIESLRDDPKSATWSVGHRNQLTPLVQRIGLPHFWVERNWDRKLLELNKLDAYNGHVPISAILAQVGVIVAVLAGYQDVIVSNEASANEPTLQYHGKSINHQYSKSLAFEQDFQEYLSLLYGDTIRYYSLLRPLSELHIAEIFAKQSFEIYKDVFSSCNHAFIHTSDRMYWDGTCAKCAFVFLALTPFVHRNELENLFEGKNLLLDQSLEPTYRQLLGIEGDKPMECVGEIKESRAAMRIAQSIYSDLDKYRFNLPTDYDYRALAEHSMPDDVYAVLLTRLQLSGAQRV